MIYLLYIRKLPCTSTIPISQSPEVIQAHRNIMKLLIVLAPLLLCWPVVLPLPQPGRVVNCDDAEVHEAANTAVQYINSHHNTGYKFALNRIENVNVRSSVSQKFKTGEIFL